MRNCCDDEMLTLAYLSLHSPPFQYCGGYNGIYVRKIQVQPRKQTDTAALPNQIIYSIYVL